MKSVLFRSLNLINNKVAIKIAYWLLKTLPILYSKALLALHDKAAEHNDVHLSGFLEGKFLDEQVNV